MQEYQASGATAGFFVSDPQQKAANMAEQDAGKSSQFADDAQSLYENLAHELARSLRLLRDNEKDADSKILGETIRSHRKALQTILDIENRADRMVGEEDTDHAIDLEKARKEILGRLDRLVAKEGC